MGLSTALPQFPWARGRAIPSPSDTPVPRHCQHSLGERRKASCRLRGAEEPQQCTDGRALRNQTKATCTRVACVLTSGFSTGNVAEGTSLNRGIWPPAGLDLPRVRVHAGGGGVPLLPSTDPCVPPSTGLRQLPARAMTAAEGLSRAAATGAAQRGFCSSQPRAAPLPGPRQCPAVCTQCEALLKLPGELTKRSAVPQSRLFA